ncbi:hypothetical protein BDZ94DRAFT_1193837 [Collybia nuda]|uniref:RING-type E3 ubiquitin transferase n=1 Tax=Collybia nuda TaxID=64659 RepID=A0A9P5Y687_9AGAR|nr:hypothetical protein BDZ94DRAFT_1193837 [Collybia nuda]
MNQNRPVTSKARGICRYYNHPRGCYAGDRCKFLHADPAQYHEESKPLLTPYDQSKRCRFYVKGFCKRGEKCWFVHGVRLEDGSEREDCSICFEKPANYGLLSGCSHIFCISCIRQWREVKTSFGELSENVKKCPMCRTTSQFIIPSSKFWKEGDSGKANAIEMYKESMSRIPCKYFQMSKTKDPARPACPFGKDCFYQHLNEDGTNYSFPDGIDESMKVSTLPLLPFPW